MWTPYVLALLGLFQTVGLGILSWFFIKIVHHEKQLYRLVSDRESEKRSIANVHNDFEQRLRILEHSK